MRRKRHDPGHIEPPSWYRIYSPEMWDAPDQHEQAMQAGCRDYGTWGGEDWPAWLHEAHARRRWNEAKYAYLQAHPQLAEQEFEELVNRAREVP